jgi:hypothetical protein
MAVTAGSSPIRPHMGTVPRPRRCPRTRTGRRRGPACRSDTRGTGHRPGRTAPPDLPAAELTARAAPGPPTFTTTRAPRSHSTPQAATCPLSAEHAPMSVAMRKSPGVARSRFRFPLTTGKLAPQCWREDTPRRPTTPPSSAAAEILAAWRQSPAARPPRRAAVGAPLSPTTHRPRAITVREVIEAAEQAMSWPWNY